MDNIYFIKDNYSLEQAVKQAVKNLDALISVKKSGFDSSYFSYFRYENAIESIKAAPIDPKIKQTLIYKINTLTGYDEF